MKKILCFAGSNSRHSINTILVNYVANKIIDHEVKIISLLDYELPMYSLDLENERSFSADLQVLRNIIKIMMLLLFQLMSITEVYLLF